MTGYVLTPLSKADIFDIWAYIAEKSEPVAAGVEQAIYDACAFLAEGPLRRHTRPDLTTLPLRFWTLIRYPNYTVVESLTTVVIESLLAGVALQVIQNLALL